MKRLAFLSVSSIALGNLTLNQWIQVLGIIIGVLNLIYEALKEIRKEEGS